MAGEGQAQEPQKATPPEVRDQIVETHHTVTIGRQLIGYTARAGTIVLKEEAEKRGDEAGVSEGEKPRATLFFIAYHRDDVSDVRARPITFSFNGGPGSSSVWLHLGILGPRRVDLGPDGFAPPPPYRLVENDQSLLDVTDLVFIDPVSTGYSRVVPGEAARQFHAFTRDIESVGDFIRLYTTRYHRWGSPKFLIGESYGTTRAAGLSGYLQERHGMYLNGIMLISTALNFGTLDPMPGHDLPYVLILPSYTATAFYHRRLASHLQQDLRRTLAEAEAFAYGPYASALLRGAALPSEERAEMAARTAALTGLTPEFVERCDLRIELGRFCKELLRDQRRTVGRLDSRFTGIDRDTAGERMEFDPSLAAIMGPYTAMINAYVRGDLAFESDLPYEVLTGRVYPWSYGQHENQFVEVGETLRKAICANPALQVYVASGYYDLATPYLAGDYVLSHLGLEPELRANITVSYFEAGHMMYIHEPSLVRQKADLAAFIEQACRARG